MKRFRVCIETKPSALWLLEEDELLHFILAPAMDFAKQNGLHIIGFYFLDGLIDIRLQGAANMLDRFLFCFEDYVAYALQQRRPEYSNDSFEKISGLIEVLPVLSEKQGREQESVLRTFNFHDVNETRLSQLAGAPP